MTTPSHTSAMPAGGIRTQHVDQDFADFVAGRPVTQRVCITVLQPAGIASSNQEKGRKNTTKYETVHLAEVTDPHKADELRHLLTQIQADRGLLAKQPGLFDATEDEQRESLIDIIRDWASETNTPMAEVDQRFVDYFGGAENATSETVQACRSVVQLKEFAYTVGALAETTPDDDEDDPEDDVDPDDDSDDDPASDGDSAATTRKPKTKAPAPADAPPFTTPEDPA